MQYLVALDNLAEVNVKFLNLKLDVSHARLLQKSGRQENVCAVWSCPLQKAGGGGCGPVCT